MGKLNAKAKLETPSRKGSCVVAIDFCPEQCACHREIARWQAHIEEHGFDLEALEDQCLAILTHLVCAAVHHPDAEIRAYCRWQRDLFRKTQAKAGWA
jgi:hypothetical protein